MLDGPDENQDQTQDVRFNPFHSRDFIIVILEWCPPETLSKLNRSNTYIRGIIAEKSNYLIQISEFKYKTVCGKYENFMKAYKAREDTLLSIHLGFNKFIQDEDESTDEVMSRINTSYMTNNYMGYRANKTRDALNIPKPAITESIGSLFKPTYDIDNSI
jgi:hypothetical protein